MLDGTLAPPANAAPAFDFRRPSKFGREPIRSLENLHESFARRFAGALTHLLRTVVQVKPMATDEITYENYLRSLPNPSVLVLVALPPLPGYVVVETSVGTGLTLVDRVLGGFGAAAPPRRPTEVETRLLAEIVRSGLPAFEETFGPLVQVTPGVAGVETNPSFLQIVPSSETSLLLSFAFSLAGHPDALLTLCYPYSILHPVMDRLHKQITVEQRVDEPEEADIAGMAMHVGEMPVGVSIRLRPSEIATRDLASLRPGDVLRLDHRADEPVVGVVGGCEVVDGFIGRRGRRLGFRLNAWRI